MSGASAAAGRRCWPGRGIGTALDLRDAADGWVRQRMGVTGLRTVHELRGIACHELETQPAAKQTTCCSRSFSRAIADRGQVRDAIVSFAERTAEKIRRSDQVCGNLQVSIATDSFDTAAPQYTTAASAAFLAPTADSRVIVAAALRIFERLWREGFAYRKAGVMLLDLSPAGDAVGSLFQDGPLENGRLMQAVDRINERFRAGLHRSRAYGQGCRVANAPGTVVPALHHSLAGLGGGAHRTRRTAW